MGDRSAIVITNSEDNLSNITLYAQWGGKQNLVAVRNVLSREDVAIGDYSRLSAQLFYEFSQLTGFAGGYGLRIFTGDVDLWEDNPSVIVNSDTGEYCVQGEETQYEYALPSVQERYGQYLIDAETN